MWSGLFISYNIIQAQRIPLFLLSGPGRNQTMSTYPRLESRVSALERRQTILDARIEELSEDTATSIKQLDARIGELSRDMTVSFKQLVQYHIQQENQIDTR